MSVTTFLVIKTIKEWGEYRYITKVEYIFHPLIRQPIFDKELIEFFLEGC